MAAQELTTAGRPGDSGSGRPAARRWLTRRHLQLALGTLWLLDGALQLQPYMFRPGSDGFIGSLAQNAMGRPNPLTDLIRMAVSLFASHQLVFNAAFATVQIAIGIGLLWRPALKAALVLSVAWGLVVWVLGEALGQMPFPQASTPFGAPGAALLYIIAALVLWPRRDDDQPAVADGGLLGARGARWAWAAVWGGTALLELEQANHAPGSVSAQLANQADGQPGLLSALDHGAAHLLAGRGVVVALAVLVVQAFVAQGVLGESTRRLALGVGVGVALVYWVVAQSFGGILTGQATDPNSGPLFVLLALALWPRTGSALPVPSMRYHDTLPVVTADSERGSDAGSGGDAGGGGGDLRDGGRGGGLAVASGHRDGPPR